MPKFDFVHIGLGKCMSSRLQGHWELDTSYNALSAKGIANAVDQIISQGVSLSTLETSLSGINLNFPEFDKSTTNIMTSEDLTFSYLHDSKLGSAIPLKDEAASRLLAGMSDKVLMLVRDPVNWIHSCHAQHVKEGGAVSLERYLDEYRDVILNNLNLENRIKVWSRFGAEVVVLPLELAKSDDAAFWNAYEDRLGVSRPSNWNKKLDVVGENTTDFASIEPHRRLNEILLNLEKVLKGTDLDQKEEMIRFMNAVRKLCIRRAISYADEQALDGVFKSLNLNRRDHETSLLSFDSDYAEAISDSFIAPLQKDSHFEAYDCLEEYVRSVSAAIH